MTESSLFREVDEALQAERAAKLWQQHGMKLVGMVVAIVLGVAGGQIWRGQVDARQARQTDALDAVIVSANAAKDADAAKQLQAYAAKPDTPHVLAAQAKLRAAARLRMAGEIAAAVAEYKAVIADAALPDSVRNLAEIQMGYAMLDAEKPDIAAFDGYLVQIQPLTVAKSAWRGSALELTGLMAMQKGDVTAARTAFTSMIGDMSVPQSLRQRANAVLSLLPPAKDVTETSGNEKGASAQ